MELIERYIHSVGKQLPNKNKGDILNELRSTLVDALEARYGKGASEDQIVALLKEFGHPEKVAASYWPEGQYLIGPRLFPLFKMAAGIALSVLAIVQVVILGVMLFLTPEKFPGMGYISDLFNSLVTTFGFIVLVFAILQRLDVRPDSEQEDWDPRQLPQVEEKEDVNRLGTVIEIVAALVFTFLLVWLPEKIGGVANLGAEIVPNPVLERYIPLLVSALLLGIVLDVMLLYRGRWELSTRIAKIGIDAFGVGVLIVLLAAHNHWLAAHGAGGLLSFVDAIPTSGSFSSETVQILVVNGFRIGFSVALIVTVIELGGEILHLVKRLLRRQATAY